MRKTVGVVGLGLIGGSIAKALRSCRVIGVDPRSARAALRARAIEATAPLSECDLVVAAAPLSRMRRLLPRIAREMRRDALLMDVASVKAPFDGVLDSLPVEVISGHPLAGTEKSGFENSDGRLFRGRPFLLIPRRVARKASLRLAEEFVRALGARPVWIADARAHDLAVALVSHLPHAAAYALIDAAQGALASSCGTRFLRRIAGPSFLGATRVAASPPRTVTEYFLGNRPQVLAGLARFLRSLRRIRAAIRRGRRRDIEALLRRLGAGL